MESLTAPIVAGFVAVVLWHGKRTGDMIDRGFAGIIKTTEKVVEKVDLATEKIHIIDQKLKDDYVTRDLLDDAIRSQRRRTDKMFNHLSWKIDNNGIAWRISTSEGEGATDHFEED